MWKPKRTADVPRPSERATPVFKPPVPGPTEEQVHLLSSQIERLAIQMERSNFYEYVQLLQRPRRIIFLNLLGGIARGVGIGVGFTLIGATLVILLQKLAVLNLPIIGDFIADIVRIVQAQLHTPTI